MTGSDLYLFNERVYDATQEEHDELLGVHKVGVITAIPGSNYIGVDVFDTRAIAFAWIAAQRANDIIPTDYYVVGADVNV